MSASIPIQPVIMAGGSGTRLWPLSRAGFPKQFLALAGDERPQADDRRRPPPEGVESPGRAGSTQERPQADDRRRPPPGGVESPGRAGSTQESLFQQAVRRLAGLAADDIRVAAPLIVGNAEHRFLALEQLREQQVEPASVILEPVGRNTAPALTMAALAACDGGADPVLVVSPADQTVADAAVFTRALQAAVRGAAGGAIVILGITPDRPETGYGYIRSVPGGDDGLARVAQFVEKPDAETAARYLAEGGYAWNSGMFVLRASTWLKALGHFRPDILDATRAAWNGRQPDARFVRPTREAFLAIPAESVDYAVMEHCPGSAFDIRMVPLDAGWSDLGAWDAVWQVGPKDAAGNSTVGDVMMEDSRNTLVHATGRLVATVGLDDVVIVETADAVLVAGRDRAQDVKKLVGRLDKSGRNEHALHRKVHRPWGWYDSIDMGPRFQVKRIMVKPGASLSLQMHHHRAEHWIVVQGTAEVTCGERKIILAENQSTYIPLGETHRLANPGKLPLEIIEVQSGSYLGEDDIVRFEDTYGRQ